MKRRTNLLHKAGALVLAAFMLFGNLCLPGSTVSASAAETTTTPAVYWSEDFEDFTLTDGVGNVTGWTQVGNVFKVVTDTTKSDNQVMRLHKSTTGNTVIKSPAQSSIGNAAVLEYDLYFPVGASVVYPLTLMSGTSWGGVQLALEGNGTFRRDGGTTTYATLEQGKQHNIKLAADIENNCWYLWINGNYIPVADEDKTLTTYNSLTTYTGCLGGTPSDGVFSEDSSGIYYDNIKISQYIRATSFGLTETEATLKVNETKQLAWTFAPANATDNAVVFESSAEAVATVDSKGMITAVSEGTAVITAKPANGMAAQSVTVTVEKDKPAVYWSEDFSGDKTLQERGFTEHSAAWGDHWVLAQDPKNGDNQVMQLNKLPTGGKNLKHIVFTEAVKQAVLEYKVYYTDGAVSFFLPTFQNSNNNGIYAAKLVLEGDGDLRHDSDVNTMFTNLSKDTWHTIKLVADAEAGKWYLFVDGAYIPVASNTLAGTGLVGMISGTTGTANTIGVYFDDFSMYELIPATGMTVQETDVELEVGKSQKLTVS
jgi:uncharacterized protein YjdB